MKQRGKGRPFKSGQSGNPAGRPKGALNKTTKAAIALMEGEAENITRKVIEAAKGGDITAIKLVLDRVVPPRKSNPITLDMPQLTDTESINKAHNSILQLVAKGALHLEDAQTLSGLVLSHGKLLSGVEFELRLATLERRLP